MRAELFENDPGLETREVGAETEVRAAAAERHVVIGLATEIELVRLGKDGGVAVRGHHPQRDAVARLDLLARDLDVPSGPACVVHDGRREAQHLLHGDRGVDLAPGQGFAIHLHQHFLRNARRERVERSRHGVRLAPGVRVHAPPGPESEHHGQTGRHRHTASFGSHPDTPLVRAGPPGPASFA